MIMDKISLALVIIGALNWGGIGLFRFDTVAWNLRRAGQHCGPHHLHFGGAGRHLVHLSPLPGRRSRPRTRPLNRSRNRAAPAGPAAPPPWRPSAAHSRPPQRTACPAGAVTAPLLAPTRPTPPSPKAILLWGTFAGPGVSLPRRPLHKLRRRRPPGRRRRFYRPSTCAYFISSAVSRAIMISSLVGTTHTSTLLSAPEMRTSSPRLLLAARSAVTPR